MKRQTIRGRYLEPAFNFKKDLNQACISFSKNMDASIWFGDSDVKVGTPIRHNIKVPGGSTYEEVREIAHEVLDECLDRIEKEMDKQEKEDRNENPYWTV